MLYNWKKLKKNKNNYLFYSAVNRRSITNKRFYFISLKRGFSLVEMIISVSIFAIIMTISIGSLLTVLDANEKERSLKLIINNLNLAMESISRELRMGGIYHGDSSNTSSSCYQTSSINVAQDCTDESDWIAFKPVDKSSSDDRTIYRWIRETDGSNNVLFGYIERSTDGGDSYLRLTSPDMIVENMQFFVTGTSNSDNKQPKILISMRGYVKLGRQSKSNFSLQTLVSQREIDS